MAFVRLAPLTLMAFVRLEPLTLMARRTISIRLHFRTSDSKSVESHLPHILTLAEL